MKSQPGPRRALAATGLVAVALGAGAATLNMLGWYYAQAAISFFGQATKVIFVLRFYLTLALATAVVVLGAYLIYRALRLPSWDSESSGLAAVISNALQLAVARRAGIYASLAYVVIYAFASSLVVYQPGVDFLQTYGVSAPGWTVVACCGSPGTVPSLVLFMWPQLHLALQLIPLNLVLVVLLPLLVGFNFAVTTYAVANRPRISGRWLSSIGAMAGVFTGCPTCAGYFLAAAVGGVGATTLTLALVPYQAFFIVISLLLLLSGPFITAVGVRSSLRGKCNHAPLPAV